MTIAATRTTTARLTAAPPRRARPRSRAINSLRKLIDTLFLVDVAILFTVSGGMLWFAGLNYDGLSGSGAAKIHPATYLAVACFLLLLFTRRNPAAALASVTAHQNGALILLAAFAGVMMFVVIDQRPGPAGLLDTFCFPAVLTIVAAQVSDRDKTNVEKLLHIILAVNALMTLVEFVLQTEFFPYRMDGETLVENRPCGLQGHPLSNAVMTGLYGVILLSGGGRALPGMLRTPVILLQLAALVASGGRTALTLMIPFGAFILLRRFVGILLGERMSPSLVIAIFATPALAAVAIAALVNAGFFDVMLQRFDDDGGSAAARVQMVDMLSRIPFSELLLAPDIQKIDSLRRSLGLELGIENPIVRFVLYQGVIATTALLVGVTAFLRGLVRPLQGRVGPSLIYFLLLINSFESIGSKSTLLAKFAILMIAMFRPENRVFPQTAGIIRTSVRVFSSEAETGSREERTLRQ